MSSSEKENDSKSTSKILNNIINSSSKQQPPNWNKTVWVKSVKSLKDDNEKSLEKENANHQYGRLFQAIDSDNNKDEANDKNATQKDGDRPAMQITKAN